MCKCCIMLLFLLKSDVEVSSNSSNWLKLKKPTLLTLFYLFLTNFAQNSIWLCFCGSQGYAILITATSKMARLPNWFYCRFYQFEKVQQKLFSDKKWRTHQILCPYPLFLCKLNGFRNFKIGVMGSSSKMFLLSHFKFSNLQVKSSLRQGIGGWSL